MVDFKIALRNFFRPDIASEALRDEIKGQRKNIKILKEEYLKLTEWHHQYVSSLSMLTEAMDALVWKKDKNHQYLLANPLHCQSFFGFEGTADCLKAIVGRTDEFLIKSLFKDHKIQNTFGATCRLSDEFTKGKTDPVHFLEAGIVDGVEVLLYVVKTPQYTNTGKFIGTLGIGWNVTSQSDFLVKQLNRWIYAKKAEILYHAPSVFCYVIEPGVKQCKIFHHICPDPERGKSCGGECDICADSGVK